MDCECCYSDQEKYEEDIQQPYRVYSYKDLLADNGSLRRPRESAKENAKDEEIQKISLSKKMQQINSMTRTMGHKIDSVSTAAGLVTHSFSHQRIINYPNFGSVVPRTPQLRPQPLNQGPRIQFSHIPVKIKEEPRLIVQTPRPIPAYQQQQLKKIIRPEIKIMYQQPARPPQPNPPPSLNRSLNIEVPSFTKPIKEAARVEPIKVEFQNPPPFPQGLKTIVQQRPKMREMKLTNRKSSIEFNREMPRGDEFRGKLSQMELKKMSSYDDAIEMPEDRYQSSNLIKSTKLASHIEDMQCKNTESVADANDSFEESSEVIAEHQDFPELQRRRKMTNSETKFGKSTEKNSAEQKRSIIWENSRKESLQLLQL